MSKHFALNCPNFLSWGNLLREVIPAHLRIDFMRAFACIALVLFHVSTGLAQKDIGSPLEQQFLQILNGAFGHVRMPLFAFIAGYVYALKPVSRSSFSFFLVGKVRRLLLPGALAATLFALGSGMIGNRFAVPLAQFWTVYVMPYAHYWFLQAIFVVLLAFAAMDILIGKWSVWFALTLTFFITLTDYVGRTSIFSLNSALYLAPFFLLGVLAFRANFMALARAHVGGVILVLLVGFALHQIFLSNDLDFGILGAPKYSLAAIFLGWFACIALFLGAPDSPTNAGLGAVYVHDLPLPSLLLEPDTQAAERTRSRLVRNSYRPRPIGRAARASHAATPCEA